MIRAPKPPPKRVFKRTECAAIRAALKTFLPDNPHAVVLRAMLAEAAE